MEPFVALMRRYCIDYTNVHDQSVAREIMRDDYEILISGRTLGMDAYEQAVTAAFRNYPTLGLTVHDMILSGDRLAMRFSEHGAPADDAQRVAVWPGISLYQWDGERLRSCRVEQDFLGRDEQSTSGTTTPLEPPHPDPWATTVDAASSPEAEAGLRAWFEAFATDPTAQLGRAGVRLLETGEVPALLDDLEVVVDDLFSAGDRVAAGITMRGTYAGGLAGVPDAALGQPGHMQATVLAGVMGGEVTALDIVRDRWGLVRRLRKAVSS